MATKLLRSLGMLAVFFLLLCAAVVATADAPRVVAMTPDEMVRVTGGAGECVSNVQSDCPAEARKCNDIECTIVTSPNGLSHQHARQVQQKK